MKSHIPWLGMPLICIAMAISGGCERLERAGAAVLPKPALSTPAPQSTPTDDHQEPSVTKTISTTPEAGEAPVMSTSKEDRLIEAATESLKLRIALQSEFDPQKRAQLEERLSAAQTRRKSIFVEHENP